MNRPDSRAALLLAALALAGALTAQDQKPATKPPATGEQALAKAQKHHRRALLTFLAGADARSEALAKAMKDEKLAHLLLYEFERGQVLPLDKAEPNDAFAAKYDIAPDRAAMPALVVLDGSGKKLAAFGPKDLFDADDRVRTAALAAALQKLVVEPLDGEQVLAQALATAKQTDKRLLLTFDAPW
jgi:hypothetical protein